LIHLARLLNWDEPLGPGYGGYTPEAATWWRKNINRPLEPSLRYPALPVDLLYGEVNLVTRKLELRQLRQQVVATRYFLPLDLGLLEFRRVRTGRNWRGSLQDAMYELPGILAALGHGNEHCALKRSPRLTTEELKDAPDSRKWAAALPQISEHVIQPRQALVPVAWDFGFS